MLELLVSGNINNERVAGMVAQDYECATTGLYTENGRFCQECFTTIKETVIARKKYATNSAEKYRKPETPKAMDKVSPRKTFPGKYPFKRPEMPRKCYLAYGLNRVPTKHMLKS